GTERITDHARSHSLRVPGHAGIPTGEIQRVDLELEPASCLLPALDQMCHDERSVPVHAARRIPGLHRRPVGSVPRCATLDAGDTAPRASGVAGPWTRPDRRIPENDCHTPGRSGSDVWGDRVRSNEGPPRGADIHPWSERGRSARAGARVVAG